MSNNYSNKILTGGVSYSGKITKEQSGNFSTNSSTLSTFSSFGQYFSKFMTAFSKDSEIISKFLRVGTNFSRASTAFGLISIGFEIYQDGWGKGIFSGLLSYGAGFLGLCGGGIIGGLAGGLIGEFINPFGGGVPGLLAGAVIGGLALSYDWSNKADKWADNYWDNNFKNTQTAPDASINNVPISENDLGDYLNDKSYHVNAPWDAPDWYKAALEMSFQQNNDNKSQSFIVQNGDDDYQLDYNYLSDFAYGLSYESFNFDAANYDSFNSYALTSIFPTTILIPSSTEVMASLLAAGYSSYWANLYTNAYINSGYDLSSIIRLTGNITGDFVGNNFA